MPEGSLTAVLFGAIGVLLIASMFWYRSRRRRPVFRIEPALNLPAAPPVHDGARLIGRYRVEREIARGSMGAVFAARDPVDGQKVAIKTLALGPGSSRQAERESFLREAAAARRLNHPDIVRIFDSGDDGQSAWLAMELVNGHDLSRHSAPPNLLTLPTLLHVGARVARALAYAHRQGVVHRDIKPANVMVDVPSGIVKVTDFGIAHLGDATRTRTGLVLGTPSFMPPEQMAGRKVDGRADLYAVGCMLFQLLTGRLPFEASSVARLMTQIANDTAPDVRTLRRDVPEALANIIAIALEKRPEVRYVDGDQMAADLDAVAASHAQYTAREVGAVVHSDGGEATEARQNAIR